MGEGGSGPGWAKFTFTFYCFPRYLHDTEMSPALLNSFSMPPFVHSRALCFSCKTWADTWTGCNGGQRTAAVQLAGLSLAVV